MADKPEILQHFEYQHLPPHLQAASMPFFIQAHQIVEGLPDSAERSAGLRKLLEAKDCIVRAQVAAHREANAAGAA